ncbi:MAG: hypothetical protein DIU82_05095 [Bacillota bacterium]|nr:MAG: hypothetical protein DIU82_05095 [Bacillota bacterium]
MPSSLTRVNPRALGFSPRLPVSVSGTGTGSLARGFSRQCGIGHFGTQFPRRHPSGLRGSGFAWSHPLGGLHGHDRRPAAPTLLRHPIARNGSAVVPECRPVVHRLRLSASA